jgi:hypothetical protein
MIVRLECPQRQGVRELSGSVLGLFPDQVYVAGIVQASLFIVLYVLFGFLYIVLFDCFLSSDQYHHCVIIRFARRFLSSFYLHKM